MTLTELRNYLEAKALDRGTAGKDNTYGAGAARLSTEAPPFVTAIDRSGVSPAPPGNVQFTVTFNKSVTGGAASNFQLATTGVSGASVSSVTGSGTTRTVTVNTGTGTGTVGLNVVNSSGVADTVGNAVAGLTFTGQVFTIANPDITLAVSPSSMAEDAAGTMNYTCTRTGATSSALTVNFSVGGSATLTTDYTQAGAATFTSTSGTVTFAAGAAAAVTVDPVADTTVESNETVVLTLTTGTGYNVGTPSAATGTITNDDTDISVTASPSSANEDLGIFTFTFTRAGVTTGALTANFSVGGTATFGSDYSQSGAASFSTTAGTVNFAAGASTATVTLTSTADFTMEADESIVLTVTSGSGYNVGAPSSASVTIINDEASISVSVSPASMNEDAAGTMAYTFTRAGYSGTALTVGFSVGGTATFSSDYTQSGAAAFSATSGTVQFGLGVNSVTVNIDPTADAAPESDETVILSISASASYITGAPSSATGTITNDDASAVSVAVSPSSMAEDAAGTLACTFTRSGSPTSALTVNFSVGGTATFSTDYTQTGAAGFGSSSGTVTFAAGSSTAVINIDPTADTLFEANETAIITVTSGSGYTPAAPTSATATINNDESIPTIQWSTATSSVSESTASTTAGVTLSGVSSFDSSVHVVRSGTATDLTDYEVAGQPLEVIITIPAGQTSAILSLNILNDALTEGNETVVLTMDVTPQPSINTIGSPSVHTLTIIDDDYPEIAVEQPAGTNLVDGTASISFGSSAIGTPVVRTFTVKNTGTVALTGLAVTKDGTNSADYAVGSLATSIAAGGSTTFGVTFTPSASGTRTAAIHIASNDADENPFDIALTGTGSTTGAYTFDATDRGWYNATGYHDPANLNYLTGNNSTAPIVEHRSFFVFNLPMLLPGETIVAAELRLDNPSAGYGSTDPSESLVISEVQANAATLVAGNGGTSAFQDLGDGTVFGGPSTTSAASNGTTSIIPLNAAFVSSLPPGGNATVVLGGSLSSLNPSAVPGEAIFGYSTDSHFTRLVITTSMPPEIAVEQPAGTDLTDGTASVNFTAAGTGLAAVPGNVRTFTIRNTGFGSMTGVAVTKDGANSADFSLGTLGATTVASGGSAAFTVTFAPIGGASGTRTAAIHIASNDPDENPFDISLTGLALSTTLDADNDCMNDWGEYQLAALGFDWQAENAALVNTYYAAANSNGLYTPAQVQALHIGAPLIQQSGSGIFTLTIGIDKSTDLTTWTPFPFSSPQTLIDGQGRVQFQFTVPDNAAFFRLQSQ